LRDRQIIAPEDGKLARFPKEAKVSMAGISKKIRFQHFQRGLMSDFIQNITPSIMKYTVD
jgi:hypothetical protein